MARLSIEQAADLAAIHQTIYDWGHELDENDGLRMAQAGVLAEDCRYNVGGAWRQGLDEIARFYAERKQRLESGGGAPVMRHIISNVRAAFLASDEAQIHFLLVFFAKVGTPPFADYCDPLAVADVAMDFRRDPIGDWRIARFDSSQIFRRG